jgi:hypothetical protein
MTNVGLPAGFFFRAYFWGSARHCSCIPASGTGSTAMTNNDNSNNDNSNNDNSNNDNSNNDILFEQLVDVAEGRVAGGEAEALLERLSGDPALHDAHRWLTDFLATTSTTTLVEVPASTRAMLEGLLPARRTLADSLRDTVGSIARLVRDVPAGAAFAGARGAASTRRQLLFTLADGADLALELEHHPDHLAITGQLLGGELAYQVELTSDLPTVTVDSDELGEFAVSLAPTAFLRLDLAAAGGRSTIDLTPFLDEHEQGATR